MRLPKPRHNPYRTVLTKNRFAAALCHLARYSGQFATVLSRDTGISVWDLRQILSGYQEPSHFAATQLVAAISKAAGRDIPTAELIVPIGEPFPTTYPCDLFNCRCHPPWAYDGTNALRAEFKSIPQGHWTYEVPTGH